MQMRAVCAGVAYFALVFAAGFGLGTLRVLLLAPRLGETGAVLIELPVMLVISWAVCRWLIARFDVPRRLTDRLLMGAIALCILLVSEVGVSVFGFGRTLSAHLEQYRQLPGLIGLAGQVAFAAFPIIQHRMPPASRHAAS